jgi:large subunit ribosomal protein L10
MAITKEKKAEILQDLVDKFGRSKTVVFSDYRGLDVSSISDLRNKLREKGAEAKVAKKTLIKLAAKESNIGELGDDVMEGPVAVTFSYEDELSGLKVLFNFSKENENLKLLGGIIDGKIVSAEEIITLAKLPSKEELYAKFLGSLNSPVSGFVGVMGNLLGGFVRVVNAYKDTLPAEDAADEPIPEPTPAPEPPAESPAAEEKPADDTPAEPAPDDTAEGEAASDEEQTPTSEGEETSPRKDEEEDKDEKPADESSEAETKEDEAPDDEEEKSSSDESTEDKKEE